MISIHLMLWFNFFKSIHHATVTNISIHLMLWFNAKWQRRKLTKELYFNTSYVMVQRVIL